MDEEVFERAERILGHLHWLSDMLFDFEQKFREVSSERDKPVTDEDLNMLYSLKTAIDLGMPLGLEDFMKESKNVYEFVGWLLDAIEEAQKDVEKCKSMGLKRGECLVSRDTEEMLEKVDEYAEKLFGKRCTWLRGQTELYTLSAFYNDVAACIHRFAEYLARFKAKRVGRCEILPNADKDAIFACLVWDKMADALRKAGWYSEEDEKALKALVRDSKVEIRVGSTPGHATHIDIGEGKVEYYDIDNEVAAAMKKLLESLGLTCKTEPEAVICTGLTRDKLPAVAAAIAFATSMDLRLHGPAQYHSIWERIAAEIYLCKEKMKELLDKIIESVKQTLFKLEETT